MRGNGLFAGVLTVFGAGGCGMLGSSSPCPDDMVHIAGGRTMIGWPMPRREWMEAQRTVKLGAYCIDRYEWPNRKGELPQGWHTYDEASAACASVGKRLCTSSEWERACRGPEGNRYSYGPQRDPTVCNTPIEGSGPGRNPAPIKPSGSLSGCVSSEGVYDLNGSLSEWTSENWRGKPEPFNSQATVDADWFTLRGGTMWSQTFYGQDCSSRHGHHRGFENMDDGFRCCQTAQNSG